MPLRATWMLITMGFTIDIESDLSPKGLSEDIVRLISAKKNEPEWLLEWRLKAYQHWVKLKQQAPPGLMSNILQSITKISITTLRPKVMHLRV
ncbi:MAG: hypothetical protein CM1200mP22_31830 [Dehalococcoidia bacterium]|nr:MAG: hypothetical protein CM1200mP22_31830 [Dehalococcoidia bacterium]